jgi:hypothetical protein
MSSQSFKNVVLLDKTKNRSIFLPNKSIQVILTLPEDAIGFSKADVSIKWGNNLEYDY